MPKKKKKKGMIDIRHITGTVGMSAMRSSLHTPKVRVQERFGRVRVSSISIAFYDQRNWADRATRAERRFGSLLMVGSWEPWDNLQWFYV